MKETMKKIIGNKAVRTAAVVGLIIALCATVGGPAYPWAFAGLGAAWVVVTALTVWNASRSEP